MAYDEENKNNFDRKMYPVKCSQCGAETEVPFEPDGKRPVYCRDCYRANKKPRRNFDR